MSAVVQLLREQGAELHISPSAVRCIQECARQYYLRYMQGLPPQDRSARMVLGSAIHRSLARFYEAMRDGKAEPGIETLVGIASAFIARAAVSDPPLTFADGEDPATLVHCAHRLLQAFLVDGYRPARVLAVEQPFSIPLHHPQSGETLPFEETLTGVFDLVAEDADGALVVVDHKTCGYLDRQKAAHTDVQMAVYSIAAKTLWGRDDVKLLYQDLITRKEAKVVIQEIQRVDEDEVEAMDAAVSALELVHVAAEHPRPWALMGRRRSWMCRACGWRRACSSQP